MKNSYKIKKVIIGKEGGMPWGASYVVLNAIHPNGDCYTEVAILDKESSKLWKPTNQQWEKSHIISLIKEVYPNKNCYQIYNDMAIQTIMDGEVTLAKFSLNEQN